MCRKGVCVCVCVCVCVYVGIDSHCFQFTDEANLLVSLCVMYGTTNHFIAGDGLWDIEELYTSLKELINLKHLDMTGA